MWSAILTFYIL